jgi:hypothetical protein
VEGHLAHPVRKGGAVDLDPVPRHHLRLAVQGEMLGELRDGDMGQQRLCGQPALDQGGHRPGLTDAGAALRAGVARADRDDHPELRGRDVEPFGTVFADPHHLPATTGAGQIGRRDHPLLARQILRQATRPPRRPGRAFSYPRVPGRLLSFGGRGDGEFDILEGQLELVRMELLGPRAEPGALEFAHKMLKPDVAGAELGVLRLQVLPQVRLGRERLHLRLDRRPELGRQLGQKGEIERGRHGRILSDGAAEPQGNKHVHSTRRRRRPHPLRHHPAPVQTFEQRLVLRP